MKDYSLQKALLELRRMQGKTQAEFAAEIGISSDYYGRLERGSIKANTRLILDIERRFDVCLLPQLEFSTKTEGEVELLTKIWKIINLYPKKNLKYVLELLIIIHSLSDDESEEPSVSDIDTE